MRTFLREYWAWIVVPIVLVVAAVLVVLFLTSDQEAAPFVYNVF